MKKFWNIAVVSQTLAILTHLYLTSTHYKLKLGLMEGKSLCNISEFLNCDSVNLSQYSSLFGIPIALWGFYVNLFLLVALLGLKISDAKPVWLRVSQVLSITIACASLVMGFISFILLDALCVFCLTTYVLSFITFFGVYSLIQDEYLASFKDSIKSFAIGGVSIVALTFLTNAISINSMATGFEGVVESSIGDWKTGKDVNLSSASSLLTKGPSVSDSKMVIVEFADFQCIHCKFAYSQIKNFASNHKDVSVIFMSFPLDGKCNPAIQQPGDGLRCDLAIAAHCAGQQGKGWLVHDWIFDNFEKPDLSVLTGVAEKSGIDMAKWRECRSSEDAIAAIRAQAKLGLDAGVQGTPAIYVNGRLLPRGGMFIVLEAVYKLLHSK